MEKIHPETGKILHRDIRPTEYEYKGEKITVNQPGWYPDDDSDAIFSSSDWDIADQAYKILRMCYEAKMQENNSNFENVSFA